MVDGFLADVGFILTTLLLSEISVLAVVKKDPGGYKFRPAEWYRDSNLEHYQKFAVVTFAAIVTVILVNYMLNEIFNSVIFTWIQSLSVLSAVVYNLLLLICAVLLGTYISRDKSVDNTLVKLILIVVILLLLFAHLHYGIFGSLI